MKKYEYIQKNKWYMQGTPGIPFYDVDPYSTTYDLFGYKNALTYFIGDDNKGFFSRNYFNRITPVIIKKQKKNRNFVDVLYKKSKFYMHKSELLSKRLEKENINKFTKKQVCDYLKEFRKINYMLWYNSLIL